MSNSKKLKLREIVEMNENQPVSTYSYGGAGTSESDCMSQDTYWNFIDRGISVNNVWVCDLGFILGDSSIWGSNGSIGSDDTWGSDPWTGSYPWGSYPWGSNYGSESESNSGSPSGGTSGGNSNPGQSPSNEAQKIAKTINLDKLGIEELNRALKDRLNNCGYEAMYKYLESNGRKINSISIDPSLKDPGAYDPRTNTITFKNNEQIYNAFSEEFIHFFQNNYYKNGIVQYLGKKGEANIEFEAKLIQDILNRIKTTSSGYITYGLNADSKYISDYLDWIDIITQDGTHIPNYSNLVEMKSSDKNLNYWNFMQEFIVNKPNYKTLIEDDLPPTAINFMSLSKCNNQ